MRILGRLTLVRRPPRVTEPSSWPWRFALRSGLCLPFGPTTSSTSSSISSRTTESPTPTESASRLSSAAPTSSPSASWTFGGSGLSGSSIAVATFAAGTLFMADPPVLVLVGLGLDAPNAPDRSGRGGRTAAQSSTRSRTTSLRAAKSHTPMSVIRYAPGQSAHQPELGHCPGPLSLPRGRAGPLEDGHPRVGCRAVIEFLASFWRVDITDLALQSQSWCCGCRSTEPKVTGSNPVGRA